MWRSIPAVSYRLSCHVIHTEGKKKKNIKMVAVCVVGILLVDSL